MGYEAVVRPWPSTMVLLVRLAFKGPLILTVLFTSTMLDDKSLFVVPKHRFQYKTLYWYGEVAVPCYDISFNRQRYNDIIPLLPDFSLFSGPYY